MADDQKEERATAERFAVEDIVASSDARFEQPSWVMAGALHDYGNVTITEADARKRLDAYLKHEEAT